MKHTKEPWEVQHNPEEDIYRGYMIIGNGMEITRLLGMGVEEDQANAYLMAASPNFYKACQSLIKSERYFGDDCPLCEGIRLSDEIMEHGPWCPVILASAAIGLAKPPEKAHDLS